MEGNIRKKFSKIDKPLLVASVIIFIAGGWLLFSGIFEFDLHIYDEYVTIGKPEGGTETLPRSMNSMRLLALSAITSACLYVAVGVSILQRRHLGFIFASLIFASIIALMLGHYDDYFVETEPPFTSTVCIGIPTLILSGITFAIVTWRYRNFL